jgi:hypothetical protein
MLMQAAGIWIALLSAELGHKLAGVSALGVGTALVYPTLIAAVSDRAAPAWRASAVGVYRFWRDAGFLLGAVGAGLVAQAVAPTTAMHAVAAGTLMSGIVAWVVMRETLPRSARLASVRERELAVHRTPSHG